MIDCVDIQYLSYRKVTQHKFAVVEHYLQSYRVRIFYNIGSKLFPTSTPFMYNMTYINIHMLNGVTMEGSVCS